MTGPEHYAEAERSLSVAADAVDGNMIELAHAALAAGQVHATLALAAATWAGASGLANMTGSEIDDWHAATNGS